MSKGLVFYTNACTGCRICELVCTTRRKGVCGRSGSLVKIVTDDKGMTSSALFCHQCIKPVCIDLCPVQAITINAEKHICIDPTKCTGCADCISCPFGGIFIDNESGLAVSCDLCQGAPECVEFCPTGALQYLPGGSRKAKATTGL